MKVLARLFVVVVSISMVIALVHFAQPALASPFGGGKFLPNQQQQDLDYCYTVADREKQTDVLAKVNYVTGEGNAIGVMNTSNVEAIAFQASTGILFAADGGQLGTVDITTAQFTALPNPFGTASGPLGEIDLFDVDSLAFDPNTGILYGAHRQGKAGVPDLLFLINPETGEHISDAFGPGQDYFPIPPNFGFYDVDDIAVSFDGVIYGVFNNGGRGDRLAIIDFANQTITDIGPLGVDDMEGLSFDPSGNLRGTTGKAFPETADRLWWINRYTGEADLQNFVQLPTDFNAFDYESLACLLSWQQVTPTPTPTETSTPTPEVTVTATPVNTPTPTIPPTPTPTEPTAVELLYFRAAVTAQQEVELSWATGSEINNVGFNLYRSPSQDLSQAVLAGSLTASNRVGGASYRYIDAPGEGVWWYWLADVDTSSKESFHGPLQVALGAQPAFVYDLYLPFLTSQH